MLHYTEHLGSEAHAKKASCLVHTSGPKHKKSLYRPSVDVPDADFGLAGYALIYGEHPVPGNRSLRHARFWLGRSVRGSRKAEFVGGDVGTFRFESTTSGFLSLARFLRTVCAGRSADV